MAVQLAISRREANIWGSLAIDLITAVYYFSGLAVVGVAGGLANPALVKVAFQAVVLAIIVSIVVFTAIRALTPDEPMDERDYRIQARANTAAYYVLTAGVLATIGHLAIYRLVEPILDTEVPAGLGTAPGLVVHMLLAALIVASVSRSATQLVHYRRGG